MGRERGGQSSPDLFSADAVSPPRSRPPAEKPMAESAPQRHVLPKNLPNAVKHLNDDELETLHAATFDEMKRRGKLPPSGSGPLRRDTLTKRSPKEAKISHNRREDIAEASLPSGKVNAVRAPSRRASGPRPLPVSSESPKRTSRRRWPPMIRSGENTAVKNTPQNFNDARRVRLIGFILTVGKCIS